MRLLASAPTVLRPRSSPVSTSSPGHGKAESQARHVESVALHAPGCSRSNRSVRVRGTTVSCYSPPRLSAWLSLGRARLFVGASSRFSARLTGLMIVLSLSLALATEIDGRSAFQRERTSAILAQASILSLAPLSALYYSASPAIKCSLIRTSPLLTGAAAARQILARRGFASAGRDDAAALRPRPPSPMPSAQYRMACDAMMRWLLAR